MTKDNNTSPNNKVNQNNDYPNNYYNGEQNTEEFYQNNNQYYNNYEGYDNYNTQGNNLNNYNNENYYNYGHDYNTNQNYNNYNHNYSDNELNYNNYSQDKQYESYDNTYYSNYNQGQNYNSYSQNNQDFGYGESNYNQNSENYNQDFSQNNYNNENYNAQPIQNNYNEQSFENNKTFVSQSYNQSNYEKQNLNSSYINSAQDLEQNTYFSNQNDKQEFINDKNIATEQSINNTLDNNKVQSEQYNGQNNNKGIFETVPPVPPIINNKSEDTFAPKKEKKSKKKIVAAISTLLGFVLLAGGGYYYYSKKAKTKVVNENEVYGSIIQKYKAAINNPDSADKSINAEALKAALKEKKNDDYIKYVFYDIDGNGRKELLISRNDKPNNPIDMYTFDKNNKVIRLFNPETIDRAILDKLGVDGSNNNSGSAVFKDKTIRIRKFDKDTGEYNFLKFSEDGNKLEKTNVITFTGLDVDNSKYKDITTGKEYDSKISFNSTFPLPEILKFDNENWKSVKNFGEKTEGDKNNNKNNTDKNENKKPDNYEKAYANVLKDYQDAINKGKSDKQDINPVAISNYTVFGEKQVGKNFLNYGFFDINGDGKDELLLFTEASKDKPNEYSPMDVYTLDKNNKVVRITPEFVNGERTTLSITKDKAFHVYGSGGAKVHGYTFYKLINEGTALEKTDDFSFDADVNPKEYERHYPVDKVENIPVDQFKEKVINKNNYIKFDFSKRKSIFDFKG
ncbi:hypothetical protein [Gemella sp.]